ncbi:MAG: hypothetical protein ABIH28_03280 [archaeon]
MAKRKLKSKNKPVHYQTRLERFFYLSCNKAIVSSVALILFVILHNFSNEFFGIQEPVIFLIAIVLLVLYLIKASIYTWAHRRVHRKNK